MKKSALKKGEKIFQGKKVRVIRCDTPDGSFKGVQYVDTPLELVFSSVDKDRLLRWNEI